MPERALHIAFVIGELPYSRAAGHLAQNMAFIDYCLGEGHEVTLYLSEPRLSAPMVANTMPGVRLRGRGLFANRSVIAATAPSAVAKLAAKAMVDRLPGPWRSGAMSRMRAMRHDGADVVVGAHPDEATLDWIARDIARLKPDVVLVDTIFRAPIIPRLGPARPPVIVITHDIFHLRLAAMRARGIKAEPKTLSRETERDLLAPADVLIAINPDEQKILKEMLPEADVIVSAMPIVPVRRPAAIVREPHRVLFTGSDGAHNRDGLAWFLSQVWPLIRKQVPDAVLDVCGRVGSTVPVGAPAVMAHGLVPSLEPYCHRAAVAITPLKAGSGLKIKMLDYFAHGLPCVTTSIGAMGFAEAAEPPFVVADEPVAFADAVVDFLRRPERVEDFERRAYDYCAAYSSARMFADVTDRLRRLTTPTKAAA